MLDNGKDVDADGYYTLVVSSLENRPDKLDELAATWMDWGPYLDGQITYRLLFRESPLVKQMA